MKTLWTMFLPLFFTVFFAVGAAPSRAAELVYFWSETCPICEQWDEEVGQIYAKTEESQILPLRRVSVFDDRPEDLAFIRGIVFTPTFVAIEDGREIGRIVGYISDYFFWGQVGKLVKKVSVPDSLEQKKP